MLEQQAVARQAVAEELATLSPEVNAKVRLLAEFEGGSGAGIPRLLFPDPPELHISRPRMFELMDGTNLWEESRLRCTPSYRNNARR